MKKKILFIVTEDWYFLSHRLSLALHAKKKGFDVELICNCNRYKKKIESHDIKVTQWDLSRKSYNIIGAIKSIIQLLLFLSRHKPDLIYAVAIKPVMYTAIISNILNIRNIIYAMGGLGFTFSSNKLNAKILRKIFTFIFKLNIRKNSYLILQNNDDKKIFQSMGLSKSLNIRIIKGSGVDIDKFAFKKIKTNGEKKIILASRMLWDKGIEDFIFCAKKIKKKTNARFILVGNPDPHNPESINLTTLKKWNSEGNIEWWGHKDDMIKIYEESTIVCLPSYREGLPKVLIEAGSIGRPVVSYDVVGCKEVVINNKNGLLVPFREKSLLSEAIYKLLDNVELCKKMGLEGREIVEQNFSEKIIFDQISNVWTEALRKKL